MIVLFFGSDDCSKCAKTYKSLRKIVKESKQFIYVDAIHDWNQDLCDYWDVDELPHIIVLDNDMEVICQVIGSGISIIKKYF